MRPLTEGKLQAESVRRWRGKVNKKKVKKKNEKVAKYIEASAVPVKNGARKLRKRTYKETTATESEKVRKKARSMECSLSRLHAIPYARM